METTAQLIDRAKQMNHLPSDYAIAAKIGVARQKISQIRAGVASGFRDSTAVKIARLLGEEPGYVFAVIGAEHSTDPDTRRAWERTAAVTKAFSERRKDEGRSPTGIERRKDCR